jgi:alkane 1-monooxygenase
VSTSTADFPPAEHHHHDDEDNPVELNPPETWHDPKRYAWLLGLIIPLAPFIAWGIVSLTGWGIFWFGGPAIVFGVFPLLDQAIGTDSENPPDSVLAWLEADRYYRWVVFAYLPLQYAGLIFACWQWAYGDLSVFESIGLATTVGTVSGIAINTAHELGHKREKSERWLSRSRSRRLGTATSSSSTTAATTFACRPRRIRRARSSVRASTSSGRAPSGAA